MKAIICFIFIILIVPNIWAASYRDGKDIWQNKCTQCHAKTEGAPQSASFYASVQWKRFFVRDRHKSPRISEVLSDDEKEQILNYLKTHAADSDHPEVAGIN